MWGRNRVWPGSGLVLRFHCPGSRSWERSLLVLVIYYYKINNLLLQYYISDESYTDVPAQYWAQYTLTNFLLL